MADNNGTQSYGSNNAHNVHIEVWGTPNSEADVPAIN